MAKTPRLPQCFDEWRQLAASDPDGFERMRREAVEQLIASAPDERRDRLRRLQWRVDEARRRAGSPLAGCIALSGMMWESVVGRRGLLEALGNNPSKPLPGARVLPFPERR